MIISQTEKGDHNLLGCGSM